MIAVAVGGRCIIIHRGRGRLLSYIITPVVILIISEILEKKDLIYNRYRATFELNSGISNSLNLKRSSQIPISLHLRLNQYSNLQQIIIILILKTILLALCITVLQGNGWFSSQDRNIEICSPNYSKFFKEQIWVSSQLYEHII